MHPPLYPMRSDIREAKTQGTEAPGCVDAAQPLGSNVRAHGEGRRRPRESARDADPHKAGSTVDRSIGKNNVPSGSGPSGLHDGRSGTVLSGGRKGAALSGAEGEVLAGSTETTVGDSEVGMDKTE